MERLEQLGQQREPRQENLYPYPITEREQILIRLYSYYQLGMTPQRFYQKWDLTQEDIALICSCSAHTVNGWFNTSRRCNPPTAIHLQPLAIMDFLLEDFETIPKDLLERCSAVLGVSPMSDCIKTAIVFEGGENGELRM
ncbi:hypothetical protein BJP36_12200 [Moorena producens JHB]|uniref:Helix-turn-helix domain-containing protein n=1 Tax=Moorena producens (strain JHB) TaxID=1454205 RepID=A0A1D9FYW9_MOOP1|nr:hypothetical protein [Moorena producens]AOY80566.1 hypothetical protein BJP36_12200 [Moorena producens JHB]